MNQKKNLIHQDYAILKCDVVSIWRATEFPRSMESRKYRIKKGWSTSIQKESRNMIGKGVWIKSRIIKIPPYICYINSKWDLGRK